MFLYPDNGSEGISEVTALAVRNQAFRPRVSETGWWPTIGLSTKGCSRR